MPLTSPVYLELIILIIAFFFFFFGQLLTNHFSDFQSELLVHFAHLQIAGDGKSKKKHMPHLADGKRVFLLNMGANV